MKQDPEQLKEYIKHFDSIFGTDAIKHIKFKNLKLLQALIEYFGEDLYKPSLEYEKIREEYYNVSDDLESTLTQNQRKLFEKYCDVSSKKTVEVEEQLFMFGYILGSEMNHEFELGVKHYDEK